MSGGSPSPNELTNVTGCAVRPSTSGRLVPDWRSARSSAADSNVHRRQLRCSSNSGGSGHMSIASTWARKSASVAHSPVSGKSLARRLTWASGIPTCSPMPSSPRPCSRSCVVEKSSRSVGPFGSSTSNEDDSIAIGRSLTAVQRSVMGRSRRSSVAAADRIDRAGQQQEQQRPDAERGDQDGDDERRGEEDRRRPVRLVALSAARVGHL